MSLPAKPATEREVPIASPVTGRVIDLADVPDPVFSSKAVGDGLGVEPDDGTIVSPVDATVTMVAGTGHAIGFKADSGLEVLVHLGVDTVELEGEPFDLGVSVGDAVRAGDALGTMDLEAIRAAGKATTAIVVLTNTMTHLESLSVTLGEAEAGTTIATAVLKSGESAAADDDAAGSGAVSGTGGADGLTGFDATAAGIIRSIGGPDNVRSVLHCITRVRFYLKDQSLADDAAVADTEGVIDVAKAGGQYQVVIGPAVEDVYDAVVKQLPGTARGDADGGEVEEVERPTTLIGWLKLGFSSMIGVITGSMIPVIGLLAASGVLKGILSLLTQFDIVGAGTSTYKIIDAMSSSVFYFLPIIIGFTAARRLGSDPIVVAIIGGVLCYPSLIDLSNSDASDYRIVARLGQTVFNADFFGIPVSLPERTAYTSSIFPIIVAAWLAARIEPVLKRRIPVVVRSIFMPLLEVFIVSALILLVFGPVIMFISGLKEKEIVNAFTHGASELVAVSLIIGMARGVNLVLEEGMISDTILNYTSQLVSGMPASMFILGQLVVFIFLGLVVPSSSGLAVLAMPIMAPLADAVGIPRFIVVSAYNWGQYAMLFLAPTGLVLVTLQMLNIPFNKWVKFVMPMIGVLLAIGATLLVIQVSMYGR